MASARLLSAWQVDRLGSAAFGTQQTVNGDGSFAIGDPDLVSAEFS